MRITYNKEISDYQELIEQIRQSGWIDSNTIIVCCKPEQGSILCQMMNHKLSHINRDDLFEYMMLEIPDSNMSQIWDQDHREYVLYDRYLVNWVAKLGKFKFLFITSNISDSRPYNHLRTILKAKMEPENYRFASCYLNKESDFKPDFFLQEYEGRIIYQWQNDNKHS